eukprot:jgi/Ulvmu1/5619/UM023_0158.1
MGSQQTNFDAFVTKSIKQIAVDVRGRAAEARSVRQLCADVLEQVGKARDDGALSPPLSTEIAAQVMKMLSEATRLPQPNLQEVCLNLLHKLVAYAWLHGETSSCGAIAEDNLVTQAIRAVSVCADSMSSQVHLVVIQALLTIAMSEFFIVHGEALVQCLKIIFNLAIATDDKMISLTAHNALLQMCNTVVRQTVRSTAFPLQHAQDLSPHAQAAPRHSQASKTEFPAPADSLPQVPSSPVRPAPPNEAALAYFTPPDYNTSATTRTAQLFALAEQCDLQGLEAAFEGIPAGGSPGARSNGVHPLAALPRSSSTPRNLPQAALAGASGTEGAGNGMKGRSSSSDLVAAAASQNDSTADLVRAASVGTASVKRRASVRSLASSKSGAGMRPRVDVLEADLIMVLTALCRLAGRRMPGSENDVYISAGRHLASDILLKVMESSGNPWGSVSAAAWMTLRQPICMVLLRSSAMEDPAAFPLAPRLFACILCRTPLRFSLKAELGAFFPLLVHKPLEMDTAHAVVTSALEASTRIAGEPQLMVDLFVNYDCDLHSVNIFERWMHGLQRVAVGREESTSDGEQGVGERAAAIACVASALRSLAGWMQALEGAAEPRAEEASDGHADGAEALQCSEAEIEEAKAMKDKRDVGLRLFCKKPLKAVRLLQRKGVLHEEPAAVALWLREHLQLLDRDALGELFGMPDQAAVAVMHEYIDQEAFVDLQLDEALRQLLREFKLPGEAQKIDRIMEKFAEAYCRQNPGVFRAAEDAYRLAFATIMLNTDIHNPLADHMLGFETFVDMNSDVSDDGESVPVLSQAELRGIFDRIVSKEIRMVGRPPSSSHMPATPRKRLLHPDRLAAALGLSAFIDSFQNRSGARRLRPEARPPKLSLAVGSSKWHTAASTQHIRGILQVSSLSILDTIKAGLRLGATSPEAYSDALEAVGVAIRMSATAGHYTFTDDAVSMLTTATGVYSPAPPGSCAEARQMQALRMLMDLALGQEGLSLGPSWWLVLRCISVLEAMAEAAVIERADSGMLSPRSPRYPRTPRSPGGAREPTREGSVLPDTVLLSSLADVEERVRSAFSGLSSWLPGLMAPDANSSMQQSRDALFSPSPRTGVPQSPTLRPQLSGSLRQRSVPADHQGAALQAFACSSTGAEQINGVFARSAALDGQNVLHFFQSLCAVANQELEPLAGAPPRVTSLKRLTECLFLNMDRIRLVWGRLWAVVGPQFVSATCHEDPGVAMVALDSMKQLAAHLLQRSELTLFNWQQQALEPFLQTLRHAGSANVRCMALGCLKHFLQRYPHHLGAGWAQIVLAIWQALSDAKLAVVEEGLSTLAEAVSAADAAGCFQKVAPALLGLAVIAATLESHPHLCFAALKCIEAMTVVLLRQRVGTAVPLSEDDSADEEPPVLAVHPSLHRQVSDVSAASGSSHAQPALDLLLASEPWLEPLQTTASAPWAGIVHAYALIATHASHDAVADQGVEEAMRLLHKFSASWAPETLQDALQAVHEALFAGHLVPAARQGQSVHLPPQVLSRLLNRFQTYLPSLWTLLIAEYGALGAPTLRTLLGSLLALLHVDSLDAVRAGVAALHQMSVVLGGVGGAELDAPGWQALADLLRDACGMDQVVAVALPQRQMTVVMVQRTLVQILTHCGRCMPPAVHLELLAVLQDSVDRAAVANADAASDLEHRRTLAAGCREIEQAPGSSQDGRSPHAQVDSAPSVWVHESESSVGEDSARLNGAHASNGFAAHAGGDVAGGAGVGVDGRLQNCQQEMPWLEQQNEGGQLLVKAYLRTIDEFRESAARLPTLVEAAECAEEAQERLTTLCASILRSACTTCLAPDRAEEMGALWSLRRNGPVLCALLQALQRRGTEEAWAKVMLPRLPMLIRCDDVRVRVGVAGVYEHVLGPRVLGTA